MTNKREIARHLLNQMMGEKFRIAIEAKANSDEFGATISNMALDHVFADTWTRPVLDLKTRSIITLAILLTLRQGAEFKNHVRFALNNGLSTEELEEMLIQALPYAGFPAVSSAQTAAIEALREAGINPHAQTAKVRKMY